MRIPFYSALPIAVFSLLVLSSCRESKPSGFVGQNLSVLIWEDYLSPGALERFSRESGANVSITEVENSEQLKQSLASKPDGFDVIVADEKTMQELMDLRLLLELDSEALVARTGQIETFLSSEIDPGGHYTSPYLWGFTVLAGRKDVVKDLVPSWDLLWREDLRIALLDEPTDLMWVALLALGHEPATATEEQVKEAADRLSKRFPDITRSMIAQIPILDQLGAGEFDLVMSYNGDALTRIAADPGLEVMIPKEGVPLWLDSFAISRDAPNADLAYRFIDFMSAPEVSALSASELNYASPNRAAKPLIARELVANRALYPDAGLVAKSSFVEYSPTTEKFVAHAMFNLISGSRSRNLALDADGKKSDPLSQEGPTD